ncbi:MAG: CvpA family protein [Chloroflexota bacterium]|nr:CvpA family protein [Chloroflexota bacterium]PLS80912.1 MAG: colicin V production protein [Chloroflexota bacterium]
MFVNVLLMALFLIVTGAGFFQGTVKLVIALVTFYLSVVLASLYFKLMATYFNTSPVVAEAVSFFIILTLCFIILLAMSLYTFRYVRFPGRLEYLDRILGVGFGVILGVVLASIIAMVLQYMFISHRAGNEYPITRALQTSTQNSTLLRLLMYNILPRLFTLVSPFLPDAAIPFFNPIR